MSRFCGLDPSVPGDKDILDDLQMGIVKGHGRKFSRYALMRFPPASAEDLRAFVRSLPRGTTSEQIQHALGRITVSSTQFYYSVSLSATGMRKLGISPGELPADISFRNGMKWASRHVLGEDDGPAWIPFLQNDVDLVLVVANDDPRLLDDNLQELLSWNAYTLSGVETYVIHASSHKDPLGNETEHFGFADGISQPLFLKSDVDRFLAANTPVFQDPTFDPRDLILIQYGGSPAAYGSFLALRIIAQNVTAFRAATNAMAQASGIGMDALQCQVMGRHRDGTPLTLHAATQGAYPPADNFTYGGDAAGAKCPLHAHVRKMNQRDGDETAAYHTIARRGVLFDTLPDRDEAGLLFMCYQADLGRQFEFLQARWASAPDFPPPGMPGVDPLLKVASPSQPQRWNRVWGSSGNRYPQGLPEVTAFRGGEYFFTPPVSFLASL